MSDSLVLDVPMEFSLELVPVVCSDFTNAEGELFNDMVDEGDSAGLGVAIVDFECSDARGIIDSRVLIAFDGLVVFARESQELNINLDLMTRHLFLVALGVNFAQPRAAREPADAIALEDAINACTG